VIRFDSCLKRSVAFASLAAILVAHQPLGADPSRYQQFAQQTLPPNISPSFISIDELLEALKAGRRPIIIDVRTDEEYREAHIAGAISAPLAQFNNYVQDISKEETVVLY
jgi:3-mercaptopyruvate sulfurtransferase SseA